MRNYQQSLENDHFLLFVTGAIGLFENYYYVSFKEQSPTMPNSLKGEKRAQ